MRGRASVLTFVSCLSDTRSPGLGHTGLWGLSLIWAMGSSSSCLLAAAKPWAWGTQWLPLVPMSGGQFKWFRVHLISIWGERCWGFPGANKLRAGSHYFVCFLKESSASLRSTLCITKCISQPANLSCTLNCQVTCCDDREPLVITFRNVKTPKNALHGRILEWLNMILSLGLV